MAWQLIYTSSPRLLEAGRTGFGTVAKHRAIGALLTGSLESISQFARLAGYDPNRIIYTHRILQTGSTRFNVLSCLRDAGSDYTGRTNHIAQHLIATESEVAELIQHGVTPADILWGMDWKSCWEGDARYLEISDEVKLSSATPFSYNAWTSLTGLADHSRLPWSAAAEKGCYLVVPASMDPRQIVGEALHQYPQRAWEITFTTHLEPNDALGDFKWICLPPDSPARAQVESSSRTTFNLSQPASLPAPPPIKRALIHLPLPVEMQARPEKQVTFAPPPSGLDPASTWGMNMLGPSQAGLNMKGHDSATTRPKSSKGLLVLAALSLVMMLALGTWLYDQNEKAQTAEDVKWRADCENEVTKLWRNHDGKLETNRKFLLEKIRVESERHRQDDGAVGYYFLKKIFGKPDDQLRPGQLSEFKDSFDSVENTLKGIDSTISLPSNIVGAEKAEFQGLESSAKSWITASKKLEGKIEPWSTWDAVNKAMAEEEACWVALKSYYKDEPIYHADATKKFAADLLKHLLTSDQKLEDYDIAIKVLKGLSVAEDKRPKWLAHWGSAREAKREQKKLASIDVDTMNEANPPAWLKKELQSLREPPKRNEYQTGGTSVTKPGSSEEKPTPTSKPPEQSSPTVATGLGYPIYVASVKDFSEGELAKLPTLPMQEAMTLEVLPMGTAIQAPIKLEKTIHGATDGLMYFGRSRVAEKKESLAFQSGKLTQIPDALPNNGEEVQSQQGMRLKAIATKDNKLLFELYLKTPKTPASEYLLPTEMPQAELKNQGNQEFRVRLGSWLQRIHSVDDTVLAYRLTNNTNGNSKQIKYDLSPIDGGKEWWKMNPPALHDGAKARSQPDITQLNKNVVEALKNVETAETNQKNRITNNMGRKLSADQKEMTEKADQESIDRAKERLKKAQKNLEAANASISAATSPPPTSVKPENGRYRLSVRGITGSSNDVFIDLCIVELN